MRIGAFEIQEPVPEFQELHVLVMLYPWVDVGSVGTLTLNRLERYFGAQELGRLARPGTFFDFTRYRPMSRSVEGRRVVTTPNSIIHYARRQESPDFLLCHLLEPHAFAEEYSESLLELLKWFNVKRYCRLGAMYDDVPHTRPLLVTGSLGGQDFKDKTGIISPRRKVYQGPTTIMNLVTEGVDNLGIENMSLMVHLPQYVQLEEDYSGVTRMLQTLCSLYDFPADLPEVENGERQYRELDAVVERNASVKALVQRLEAYYDTRTSSDSSESPPLSPKIEEFLQEMGDGLDKS